MRETTFVAESQGDWRDWKDPEIHRFKPESLHGNLLPLRTNGVLVKARRMSDDVLVLVHLVNIEPIEAYVKPKPPKPPTTRRSKVKSELEFLQDLL